MATTSKVKQSTTTEESVSESDDYTVSDGTDEGSETNGESEVAEGVENEGVNCESNDEEESVSKTSEFETDSGDDEVSATGDAASGHDANLPDSITCVAIQSYDAKQKGCLSFKKGDVMTIITKVNDDWFKVENNQHEQGLVPINHVTIRQHRKLKQEISDASTRSGKELWTDLKKSIQQSSASDVLAALGAMPSGFRPSTLEKCLSEDCKYTLACSLTPKRSKTNLGFRDLSWDSNTEMLQVCPAQIQRCIRLVSCKNIPLPGAGLEILSRHIYLTLFDGSKISSNIHCVKAKCDGADSKLWTFNPKSVLPTPVIEDGTFFIRYKNLQINVGVLVEVCVTVYRQSSGESTEFSCGWVFIKLFDETGLPVNNGQCSLKLHGGTPYEQGIVVDSSLIQSDAVSPLKAMVTRFRQPKLVIKISRPENAIKNMMDFLPSTLVGPISLLSFCSTYRQILADTLIRDRISFQNTDRLQAPALAQFPALLSQTDVIDAIRVTWAEKMKAQKRSEKGKREVVKRLFSSIFMEYISIFNAVLMQPYSLSDAQAQQSRKIVIDKVQNILREKGPLGVVTSSELKFKPLDLSNLSLDVMGEHSNHHIDPNS